MNRKKLDIIQINLGNKCNQVCTHCHIEASPSGNKNMNSETADKILKKLIFLDIQDVEFTGGAPELNPNLYFFISELSKYDKNITVRTNLTILDIPEYKDFINVYKQYKVKLISSLPSIFKDTVDLQRGKNVFDRSIKVLRKLNEIGYGKDDLELDLVYNPSGDYLPPVQSKLEDDYKNYLKDKYDIEFNKLITIVNSPIRRFKEELEIENRYDSYLKLLKDNYNELTKEKIMCKSLLSVGYDGCIYDCDFNLACNKKIPGFENIKFWEIDFNRFDPEIIFHEHCYACTVNTGSSCYGSLIKEEEKMNKLNLKENSKNYYGNEIQYTTDLKTTACCTLDNIPDYVKNALIKVHDEIKMKYYGCGSPIPVLIKDLNVLDLGCGTGRDVYVLSQLVGENGKVYGIDLTENQINIAKKYIVEHMERFEYNKANVKFYHDEIENLDKYFSDKSLDVITSNCVINLLEDKEIVLNKIYKILKYGGEFYFSDVYADRRLPENIRNDPVLHGECLGGTLYTNDFIRISRKAGFMDPRIVTQREINITDEKIKGLIGNTKFYSITYRLWKLPGLEDKCEDYGHIVFYKGGIKEYPHFYQLDESHVFYKNKPEKVCGNTALMLLKTRLGEFFNVIGSFDEHFGEFKACNTSSATENDKEKKTTGCC